AVIERLDILKRVLEAVSPGVDLVIRQRVKHERVVRIGAMAHANQESFSSDVRHECNSTFSLQFSRSAIFSRFSGEAQPSTLSLCPPLLPANRTRQPHINARAGVSQETRARAA